VAPAEDGHTGAVLKEPWRHRILYAAGLGVALVLFYVAFGRDSGREGTANSGGEAVENLIPAEGSEVLAQQQIGIDLAPGYTGTLSINGEAVPDDELVDDRQTYRLIWTPSEESELQLPAGESCATASVYKIEDGPDEARLVRWCFNVT
jgi:hypothetical protein